MPICKRCKLAFPNRIKINGLPKNICKRKYCLKCSPFGKHNTKQLELSPKRDSLRICIKCGNPFTYKKGCRRSVCPSCVISKWRANTKSKALQYKGNKCIICGYDRCERNMSFHHRDPNEKEFQISGATYGWEKIKKELDKCVLLCCRCHGEIEAGIISLSSSLTKTSL